MLTYFSPKNGENTENLNKNNENQSNVQKTLNLENSVENKD